MDVGTLIKEARLNRKMTLSELADFSKLTKGFLSQVERGKSNPSLESLRRIALALHVPLASLVPPSEYRIAQSQFSDAAALVVAGKLYHENPGLAVLTAGQSGAHFLATLPPGTALTNVSQDSTPSEGALLVVLQGAVQIREAHTELTVRPGEVACWKSSEAYSVENRSDTRASLLMFLPDGCPTPVLLALRRQMSAGRQKPSVLGLPEGPMRLVAMRAQRLAERRR